MLSIPAGARPLHCHPASPCRAVGRVLAAAARPTTGSVELCFLLEGELDDVRMPAPAAPLRADGLWQHTCFEAFVGRDDSTAYCEFNVAPSSAWAAYRFAGYRDGMRNVDDQAPPTITLQREGERLLVAARLELSQDCGLVEHDPLRCGVSAVIEETDGSLSYWALAHLGARPDFHAPESFVLTLSTGRPA